jgi:hypothetical protein
MRLVFSVLLATMLYGCDTQDAIDAQSAINAQNDVPLVESAQPLIEPEQPLVDSFTMRNPEIREDILNQLTLQGVEHWENDDGSIGFNVVDTKQVDQIANEAIGVYISLQ